MKKHRIILAGCGGMAEIWVDYVQTRTDAELVALVDLNEKAAVSLAERKKLKLPIFTDLKKALAEMEADVLFDVTIPAAHKHVVTTALKAGYHVFGEKPMAESLEDAEEIIKVSKETGRHYAVMQNRRYTRQIRAFRSLLAKEEIGPIGAVHADFFIGPHFGGFRDVMDSPLIIDMAIHTFDQARFLMNADPVSVYCHEFNPPGSWYKGNASAVCIFEMNTGAVFSYRGSWSAEGFPTSWEAEWRVTGSKGTGKWDGNTEPECEVIDESKPPEFLNQTKTIEIPEAYKGQEGHFGCLDEMFQSLKEDRLAETDCTDNIKSMAMVFGAVESARSGRKVDL